MQIKLDDVFFERLLEQARTSSRKRSHHNLHQALDEPVQRLCIALKKGTYVRPHHHPAKNKWELMLALKGVVCLIIFSADGLIMERLTLSPGESLSAVELKPDCWHTVFPLTDEAVILEVKEGPYLPSRESDFAPWAPEEDSEGVEKFLHWLDTSKPGEKYHF
jgi:cupin fold WbuC family metalloprotein